MRERVGNVWKMVQSGDVLVITTNGMVRKNGTAVMGRGIAQQAKNRMPWIEAELGRRLEEEGNHAFYLGGWMGVIIVSMPVKHRWFEHADLELIIRSTTELVELVERLHLSFTATVFLPRPGCGNGGLDWADVKPSIEPLLDGRFVAVTR